MQSGGSNKTKNGSRRTSCAKMLPTYLDTKTLGKRGKDKHIISHSLQGCRVQGLGSNHASVPFAAVTVS